LALGLLLYFQGGLSLPTLFIFLLLGTGYIKPMLVLSNMSMQISLINRGVSQIDDLLAIAPLKESKTWQEPSNHGISFMDVSFAYTENNPVLRQVNFDVKPNSITAIVGPSGAGKSTIAQLLSRFWDCSMGNI